MSGIPVYTQSPINAATADGTGPKTAAAAPTQDVQSGPNTNISTTTAAPASTTSYPAARPGAAAMPGPTSAAQRYAPIQPTPTTKVEDEGPPAPQPGAVPTQQNNLSKLPPPPKAGEKYNPPLSQTTMPHPYPHQMSLPPPTAPYGVQPSTSSTSTTITSSSPYPVTLPSDKNEAPRRSLEHPPGYVQNPYASNTSVEQSQAQGVQNTFTLGNYEYEKPDATAAFGVDPEGVWNTAKAWASTAGKKLSEVESEVWKRVNGEK